MDTALEFVDNKRSVWNSPRVYGRIDVAKIPLVRRDLAIRLHVPFPSQQVELLLRECRINDSERNAMECSVQSSEEGIFPSFITNKR